MELGKVQQVTGLETQFADEMAKPTPDQDTIKVLGDQIGALVMTAASRQAAQNALDSLARTEAVNTQSLSKQLNDETSKLNNIMLDPAVKVQQQAIVDGLKTQLDASRARQASLV